MRLVVLPVLPFLLAFPAIAVEAPRAGTVANATLHRSLSYECSKVQGDSLRCRFASVMVRKKTEPENLEREVEKAMDSAKDAVKWTEEDCKDFAEQLDMREGRRQVPAGDPSLTWTVTQKRDSTVVLASLLGMCKSPGPKSYRVFLQVSEEVNTRTCKVSTGRFWKNFKRVPGSSGGAEAWVEDGKPAGPCGLVEQSRFESETSKGGDQARKRWRYIEKVTANNPGGKYPDGGSCSVWDKYENAYVVDYRGSYVGCDYLEFDRP